MSACILYRDPTRKEALEAQAQATVRQTLKQVVVDGPPSSATSPSPRTAQDATQLPSLPSTTAGLMHETGTEAPGGDGDGGVADVVTEGSGGSGGVGARGGGVTGGRRSGDTGDEGRSPVGRCLKVRTVLPKQALLSRAGTYPQLMALANACGVWHSPLINLGLWRSHIVDPLHQ